MTYNYLTNWVDKITTFMSDKNKAWIGDRSDRLNSTRGRVDHMTSDHLMVFVCVRFARKIEYIEFISVK